MAFFFLARSNAQGLKQRFISAQGYPFVNELDTTKMGFSGGFHAPSFAMIDLDNDGVDELMIKDAFSDREWVFTKNMSGNGFQTAAHLENVLPPLSSFVLCYDFNADGLKEIITGEDRLKLYTNESTDSVRFSANYTTLKYKEGASLLPIEFAVGEQPTIADVDADGKLDVLVFDADGERVQFFKNISTNDDYVFEKISDRWGFFKEAGLNFEIILGAAKRAHPGSKILALDHDADGDMDLLLSDITTSLTYFLENGKSDFNLPYDSMISATQKFPLADAFIDIPYFPSLSLADVDFDGDEDLICATSSRSPVLNGLVWFYENGDENGFDLSLKTKSFLQEDGIDAGILASVVNFDYDADGDQDLLVSAVNHISADIFSEQVGYLQLYQNIGSKTAPIFKLIDGDYLGYKTKGNDNIRAAIGDIDNNGVDDLVLGTAEGEVLIRYNTAQINEPFLFSKLEEKIEGLDVGSEAAPVIIDINNDGNNDLIIGELNGNLNLYLGQGNNVFSLENENWGNVKTNTFYWQYERDGSGNIVDSTKQFISVGGSHPSIADFDLDGKLDLICGSAWGKVYFYPAINNQQTTFKRAEEWYYNTHASKNYAKDLGEYCKPHLSDLDGDGKFELLMGMYNGGIEFFSTDSVAVSAPDFSVKTEELVKLFPNPSNGLVFLKNETTHKLNLKIYTSSGILAQKIGIEALQTAQIQLSRGMYVLSISGNGLFESKKLIIE